MNENEMTEKRYVPMTEEQKKNRKKTENKILVFLFAVLLFAVIVLPRIQEYLDREFVVEGSTETFIYGGTNKGLIIYGFSEGGETDVLEFPENIDGYPVIEIKDRAFKHCNMLVEVYIPDNITNVGSYAFAGCENLEYVELSDGLTFLNEGIFECCPKLDHVVIPESVENIGMQAFNGCLALSEITFSEKLSYIGRHAFDGCTSLTEITLYESLGDMGDGAFTRCDSLARVYAPKGSYAAAWAQERGYEVITE